VKQSQFSFEFNFRINFLDRTPLVSLNSSTTSRGPQASHPTRRPPTGALVPPNSASAHCRVPPTDTTCHWCPAMSPLAAATPGLLEPIPAHLFIHSTSQAKCAICFPFFRDESSELHCYCRVKSAPTALSSESPLRQGHLTCARHLHVALRQHRTVKYI
jgi:hypothetical protein